MFSGGKFGRCMGLTTLPPSCAKYLKVWKAQQLPGPLQACSGIPLSTLALDGVE